MKLSFKNRLFEIISIFFWMLIVFIFILSLKVLLHFDIIFEFFFPSWTLTLSDNIFHRFSLFLKTDIIHLLLNNFQYFLILSFILSFIFISLRLLFSFSKKKISIENKLLNLTYKAIFLHNNYYVIINLILIALLTIIPTQLEWTKDYSYIFLLFCWLVIYGVFFILSFLNYFINKTSIKETSKDGILIPKLILDENKFSKIIWIWYLIMLPISLWLIIIKNMFNFQVYFS